MDTLSKFVAPGILLLLTLLFGLGLSLSGKPYNGILFNIHKLVALGVVIVTSIQVYLVNKNLHPQAIVTALVIAACIGVVLLFVTGALMSAGKLSFQVMLAIHRVALFLTTFTVAGMVYFLIGRKL